MNTTSMIVKLPGFRAEGEQIQAGEHIYSIKAVQYDVYTDVSTVWLTSNRSFWRQ